MTHIFLIKHWITLHTFCNWTYNRDSIYKVFSQSYAWKEYNNVYCIIWSIFCRTHWSYYRHYIIIVYFWQWSRCVISYFMISFCSGPLSSMLHYIVQYDVFFSVVSSLAAWSGRPCCDLAKNRVCELACREVSSNN